MRPVKDAGRMPWPAVRDGTIPAQGNPNSMPDNLACSKSLRTAAEHRSYR